jgi:prevent-host-death family protein
MDNWQIQEAKAKLSEIIKQAAEHGPQNITSHGRDVAVLLSRADFDRLWGSGQSLLQLMRNSPLFGLEEVEFERNPSPAREVML